MTRPIWITIWTWWAIVLAVVLIFFLVVEGWALFHKGPGDTLSETVWYLRNTRNWLYWLILDVVLVTAITMAWLLFHFQYEGTKV